MVFSSPLFIFLFLPLILILYYFITPKYKNILLLLFSLLFYSWGEPKAIFVMLFSIVANFLFATYIFTNKENKRLVKIILTTSILFNLGLLVLYKYLGFIIANYIFVASELGVSVSESISYNISLPIGISFYTFQIISYIVDVYRGKISAQKNIINLALYISFFPQLIAGPIVRYQDIAQQIMERQSSIDDVMYGARRFIIGLAKKVIIANNVAIIADTIFNGNLSTTPQIVAWIGILAYSLQIYFDFSAYSDMAIGLARIFGFKFQENFNYPYNSQSIQEFWRRWHISLSTWFRDYLYIPLGGSRNGTAKTYFNKFTVFLLCGLWHGASWNFLIWGLYYGLLLILESLFLSALLGKLWIPIRYIYAWLAIMVGWVFFRTETIHESGIYLKKMFTYDGLSIYSYYDILIYMDYEMYTIFICAIIFSFPIRKIVSDNTLLGSKRAIQIITENMILLFVFGISLLYLVNSTYNPFIYFRF